MNDYYINEYIYKVDLLNKVYFYARTNNVANEMKELYEKGMGVKLKLKRIKTVFTSIPPYEIEQGELECLRKGNLK